ncbi:MAG: BtaA family protein [Bacteroidota bacterium]
MKNNKSLGLTKRGQNWLFRRIQGNNLVYNTCWEDPRCDRELLQLDKDSEIVMITSAGCNALAYLLDEPAKINCIDMNARQNALLELKRVFYKVDAYNFLFECFGKGRLKGMKSFYRRYLRYLLPEYAQEYWDRHIYYFSGKGMRKSFYFHGTSGFLAWSMGRYFKMKKQLRSSIEQCFAATSLEQQASIYQQIDQQIWSKQLGWVINRHLILSLAGVPKSQQQLYVTKYENGTMDFLKYCMKQVFTTLPARENYFWQLYFNGNYTEDCCPDYLKEENFETIQNNIDKINTNTSTISEFLRTNPGQYSHYVLLDHQDWLAENNVEALEEEWRLILQNSRKGTKILLRSAAKEVDFFPDFVKERVTFQKELCERIHRQDRVGTYASTYLGIINSSFNL